MSTEGFTFRATVGTGIAQLWRSIGTNATTLAIPNLIDPIGFIVKDDQIYFSASDGTDNELLSNQYDQRTGHDPCWNTMQKPRRQFEWNDVFWRHRLDKPSRRLPALEEQRNGIGNFAWSKSLTMQVQDAAEISASPAAPCFSSRTTRLPVVNCSKPMEPPRVLRKLRTLAPTRPMRT